MSARQQVSIKKWGRTVTFLDGEAGLQYPADSLNAKLFGLTYKPRNGYAEVGVTPASPGQTYANLGLGHVVNGDPTNVALDQVTLVPTGYSEFISIENRNGTVNAYSIDDDTFARTQLGSLTLATGDWAIANSYGKAYLINPGGTKTVYGHDIGDTSSLYVVEDTTYSSETDPTLVINRGNLENVRSWESSATDTYSYPIFDHTHDPATITVAITDGSATLAGVNDDDGPLGGQLQVQCIYAANKDMSGYDYLSFEIEGQSDMETLFPEYTTPEFRIAGVWTAATGARWYTEGINGTYVMYVKGMTLTAVQGFRFTVNYDPTRGESSSGTPKSFMVVSPIMGGGTYLTSTSAAHRLYDTTLDTDATGITYGVQYGDATFAVVSAISQGTITSDEAFGYYASTYSIRLGGRITLSAEAPSGAYSKLRFLRLDESVSPNKWKIISTVTVSPWGYKDIRSEYEIPALTNNGDGTSPGVTPAFSTAGVVFAFPFKQSMVWLTSDGTGNVKISKVGEPESLYTSETTYDFNDLTQPADLTLADNQADQPVWGVQAGRNMFIVGNHSAYAIQGDYPVTLSPSRQIPGSRGIAGMYSGCRFRPTNGGDGAAYMDADGNIWLVNSVPQFDQDTRAKPHELSSMVRGKIKEFLYDDQVAEFTTLDFSKTNLEFQEKTSSLWCILGRRAAVYRQDDSGSGWEFYEYRLTSPPGSSSVSTCGTLTSNGAVASSVADSGTAWTLLGYPFASDDSYATSGSLGLGTGKKTDILRMDGFKPTSAIAASATIDSITYSIERSKIGDLTLTETKVQPRKSGVDWGSNLTTNPVIGTTDTVSTFVITTGLPTVAEINAGALGLDLQYTQQDSHVDWNNPAKWTITVSGGGTSADMTVTATYIGAGTVPSFVYITINSLAKVALVVSVVTPPTVSPGFGIGNADDGLGDTASGAIGDVPDYMVTASGSARTMITLVAGTGSTVIHRTTGGTSYTAGWDVTGTYTGSASLSPYVTDTARVDDAEFRACITVTSSSSGVTSGVGWDRTCFTDDSRYLVGRNTGQLDLVEYDFRNGTFIDGTGRDGGRLMPDGYLTLERMTFEGRTARLNGVQVNTIDPDDTFTVSGRIANGAYVGATSTGIASSRWVRFPVSQIGLSHQVKVEFDESLEGVDGLAVEYQVTSRSKVK